MSAIDLTAWVDEELRPERKVFRQAVQLVLRAIAQSPNLPAVMIMKGGLLLASHSLLCRTTPYRVLYRTAVGGNTILPPPP